MSMMTRIAALKAGSRVDHGVLAELAGGILAAAGVPPVEARRAGGLLAECQRRGIDSHGVAHLPIYVARLLSGAISPAAKPAIGAGDGPIAVMDGNNALGVLVADAAMEAACRRARLHGVGVCAVRDSNHFGAAAPLVDRAAREGLIALAFSNAAPSMAPWGGSEAVLGTNPLAAAFPCAGAAPIVVDMATSAGSRGRIRQAAAENKQIPSDWALDATGRPTTDASEALLGTVQPLGGAKGYALTLMVELLCTLLSGGRPGFAVLNPHDLSPNPAGTSHLFIVFDPARFASRKLAEDSAALLAARIEQSTPAQGATPRLPGARGAAEAGRRDREGIPLTAALIAHLRRAAAMLERRDACPAR